MKYKSIFQDEESSQYCFFCWKSATDWHHIFNKSFKKKSEEYGLMLRLCRECHMAVHGGVYDGKDDDFTRLSMLKVKKYAQRIAMEEYDLTYEEWRKDFERSYI